MACILCSFSAPYMTPVVCCVAVVSFSFSSRFPTMLSPLLRLLARCADTSHLDTMLRPLHSALTRHDNPSTAANLRAILQCPEWPMWFHTYLCVLRGEPTLEEEAHMHHRAGLRGCTAGAVPPRFSGPTGGALSRGEDWAETAVKLVLDMMGHLMVYDGARVCGCRAVPQLQLMCCCCCCGSLPASSCSVCLHVSGSILRMPIQPWTSRSDQVSTRLIPCTSAFRTAQCVVSYCSHLDVWSDTLTRSSAKRWVPCVPDCWQPHRFRYYPLLLPNCHGIPHSTREPQYASFLVSLTCCSKPQRSSN